MFNNLALSYLALEAELDVELLLERLPEEILTMTDWWLAIAQSPDAIATLLANASMRPSGDTIRWIKTLEWIIINA